MEKAIFVISTIMAKLKGGTGVGQHAGNTAVYGNMSASKIFTLSIRNPAMKTNTPLAFFVVLFVLLASLGCGIYSAVPTQPAAPQPATAVATSAPLPLPVETSTPADAFLPTDIPAPSPASPESLDRQDMLSVLRWLSFAITNNQPGMVTSLIGSMGVDGHAPYASEYVSPGYDNSADIVAQLRNGLANDSPVCMGYDAWPEDRANLYISGIQFDTPGDLSSFLIIRTQDGWTLAAISVVPDDMWALASSNLNACP
jgi:hypothetical protein